MKQLGSRAEASLPRLTFFGAPTLVRRSPGIDCLRGLFASWVMFSHLIPWSALAVGGGGAAVLMDHLTTLFRPHGETHPAVLGFIVLSGYCIHRNGFRRDHLEVRPYAIRRWFRIVPVYVLGILCGALVVGVALSTSKHEFVASVTGTPEISFGGLVWKLSTLPAVLPSVYFKAFQGNAPLATVAAEMWLYAVYALVAVIAL